MIRPAILPHFLLLALLFSLPCSAQPVPPGPTDEMVIGSTQIPPDFADSVTLPLRLSNAEPISAFSAGFQLDAPLVLENILYTGTIDPDFVAANIGSGGGNIGVVFSLDFSSLLSAGAKRMIAQLTVSFPATIPLGAYDVRLAPFGSPPIGAEYSDANGGVVNPPPVTTDGVIVAIGTQAPGTIPNRFRLARLGAAGGAVELLFSTLAPDGTELSEVTLPAPNQGQLVPIAVATDGNGNSVCLTQETSVTGIQGQLFVGEDAELNNFSIATLGDRTFTALAVSSRGVCFVGDTAGGVSVVTPDGQLLYGVNGLLGDPIVFTGGRVRALALSPGGGFLWACAGDFLYRLSSAVNISVESDLGAGTLPSAVAALGDGSVVVALRGAGSIEHRAADGSLIDSYDLGPGAQPTGIVVLEGGSHCLTAVDSISGTAFRVELGIGVVDTYSIGSGVNGVTVDGDGQLWVSAASAAGGGTLNSFDADGNPGQTLVYGEVPTINGEASGLPFAIVYEPDVDEDGDGYINSVETNAQSNPFDATSDPVSVDDTFVPPLSALGSIIFTPIGGSERQIALNWAWDSPVSGSADFFEVSRINGGVSEVLATVSGDENGYVDSTPLAGENNYSVVAILGGNVSEARTTAVVLGAGQVTDDFLITFPGLENIEPYDLTDGPFLNNFLDSENIQYYATDNSNNVIYQIDDQFVVVGTLPSPFADGVPLSGVAFDPTGDGGNGSLMVANGLSGDGVQTVWKEIDLTGGVLQTYFLTEDSSPILGAHTGKTGGIAYCKAADMFYGIGPEGCQVLGMAGDSTGELDADQSGTHPSEGPGQNGIAVKTCTIDNSPFGVEINTVLYLTSAIPGGGLEIVEVNVGTSFDGVVQTDVPPISLGGFDNPAGIFFENGTITVLDTDANTCTTIQVTAEFVRGDTNFDGTVDLGDAVTVLSYLFNGGVLNYPECTEALNANDDGSINVADGVYLLGYLFGGTSPGPPPPPPFPDPGIDPTPGGNANSIGDIPYCIDSPY